MERMPVELLSQVATHLDFESLLVYSTLNRPCMTACAWRRLRYVAIPVEPDRLRASINILSQAVGYEQHIRSLRIVQSQPTGYLNRSSYPSWCNTTDHTPEYEYGHKKPWLYACEGNAGCMVHGDIEVLMRFLHQLTHLTDFIWACPVRIPASIVKHIESIDCRLHMQHFHIDSIATNDPITISPEDLQLATSPALVSLTRHAPTPEDDPHHMALADILLTAPNLTEVFLAYERPGYRGTSLLGFQGPPNQVVPRKWPKGLITPITHKARLRRIELRMHTHVGNITWLMQYTDHKALQCLKIHHLLITLDMHWLVRSVSAFNSLCDLKLRYDEDQDQLVLFVTALPALRFLQLDEVSSRCLATIVESCGNQLRHLVCTKTFAGPSLLHKLLAHCPELEVLGIGMYRAQGAASELATYHHLARFTRLRMLHLAFRSTRYFFDNLELNELKAADDSMDVSYFDTRQLDDAYLACRDLACDRTLAAAVFECISRQKAAHKTRFEALILEPSPIVGHRQPWAGPYQLHPLLESIALAWKCTSSRRDDSLHTCIVRPFGRHPTPSRDVMRRIDDTGMGIYAPVIHRLWPESQHKQSFANLWHSFPIETP